MNAAIWTAIGFGVLILALIIRSLWEAHGDLDLETGMLLVRCDVSASGWCEYPDDDGQRLDLNCCIHCGEEYPHV